MKNTILLFAGLAFLSFKNQAQTVTDIDGNVYNTLKIGTQVWMKENLKVTHYRNGDSISIVSTNTAWNNLTSGAYCNYNNDSSNVFMYGRIYNWYAVSDTRNICPIGWHVPTEGEWMTLAQYLGGMSIAGGKMKETGYLHWNSPNTLATNTSGFTSLPAGHRNSNGFWNLKNYTYWWSSTSDVALQAWIWGNYYNISDLSKISADYYNGYTIRCLNDIVYTTTDDDIIYNPIQIYPNPAIDRVSIDCANGNGIKIKVYNSIGDCVFQSVLTGDTNEIDISTLKTGIYVIQLTGTNWTIQRKLIRE